MTENYSAFEKLNLSDARSKNETREDYKKRLRQNKLALKLYDKIGRDAFQQMFPEGISYDLFETPPEEEIKKIKEKLGEAK
jgi:hypothetical protein